jgi:hypothetical protein
MSGKILTLNRANLGAKTYLIFSGWMFICIVVTYLYLPETRGRTPAEQDEMFTACVPARKFKGLKSPSSISLRWTKLLTLSRLGYVYAVAPKRVEEAEVKRIKIEAVHVNDVEKI